MLLGGGKPKSVWSKGLVHTRMVDALESDPNVFRLFAELNPKVPHPASETRRVQRKAIRAMGPFVSVLAGYVQYPEDLALQAELLEPAAASLESSQVLASAVLPVDGSGGSGPVRAGDKPVGKNGHSNRPGEQGSSHGEKQLRLLHKEFAATKRAAQRSEEKRQASLKRVKELEGLCTASEVSARGLGAERDELRRRLAKADAELQSLKTGKRTIEERRADEATRNQQTIADLQDRLSASASYAAAKDREVSAMAAELVEETARCEDIEQVLAAFGLGDVAASLSTLQAALDGLGRLREGIAAYAEREMSREVERARVRDEADLERAAAERARQARAEQEAAWSLREHERLQDMEHELFPDGEIDHILIDGHNLVHRVFRPEDEARTRPWLEHMVEKMAERLERRGWQACVHLVFDTSGVSNNRSGAHGVRVYFENNAKGGGADSQVARLLREGNPRASYMVVSTDRRHVWTDAIEFMRTEGAIVDPVQVELLARYLQALEEVDA